MLKQIVKRIRIDTCLSEMRANGKVYWWTLTTPDVCDYSEIRTRWRRVRHFLQGRFSDFRYVQNFELHPKGHGWHIHFLCNYFIDLKHHLSDFRRFGFGRVSVKVAWDDGINDYLVKHAFKPVKGKHRDSSTSRVRLINVSRSCGCPLSRFVVCGGNTGLLTPSGKTDFRSQIIAKTYGPPVLPRPKSFYSPFDLSGQLEFCLV